MPRISHHDDDGSVSSNTSQRSNRDTIPTFEMVAYDKKKQKVKQRKRDGLTTASSSSEASESGNLMSNHAMKMGLYTINLGTEAGQRLHTCHLVILPLIPVFILLAQNVTAYSANQRSISDLQDVKNQVRNALDFAVLTRRLQEERASVALNFFINRRDGLEKVEDLDNYVVQNLDPEFLSYFKMANTFNNTDEVLQNVKYWPKISGVSYFKTKLKFQIQHSLFRTKIQEGEKSLDEVLDWYNEVNTQTLNYVTYSIHDSDISDFYRWIIGYKNLMRAVEFAGKAGIQGLEYLATDLTPEKYETFTQNDVLRREYLNQTFNFIPSLATQYKDLLAKNSFDTTQAKIIGYEEIDRTLENSVAYFIELLKYSKALKVMITGIGEQITDFVQRDIDRLTQANIMPLFFIIFLIAFIPVCVIFTLNITGSMMRYSRLYNEKVTVYQNEKKKTEKLLGSLLPKPIIKQMKKGGIPKPEVFENATVFFTDIVSFTTIASESTSHQIIEFLNDLYNLFDDRLENFDVYKVETIGDAYMVASGVPVSNGSNHAIEIAKMSLDLLAKVLTFEVQHKPGYRLKLRMGIHSGSVVGGVVGTKIPHYSIIGDTVEIANLMESTGLPMKIQISESTAAILDQTGGFKFTPRGVVHLPHIGEISTFWLIGRQDEETS